MNKASRKSGGNAWKKVPENLGRIIDFVNDLAYAIKTPAILPKRQPEAYDLEPERRSRVFAPEMRRLESFLSTVSKELAKDILEYSTYYEDPNLDEIIEKLGSNQLFSPERMGRGGINDFDKCMFRLESLEGFYYLLRALISRWKYEQPRFEDFLRGGKNKLYDYDVRLTDRNNFELIKIDSERTINLGHTAPLIYLQKVEIDRLRICPKCDKIFWAGRINMLGCSKCSPSLRNKKWREKTNDEQRENYNRRRSQKRLSYQSQNIELKEDLTQDFYEEAPLNDHIKVGDIVDDKQNIVVKVTRNSYTTEETRKKETGLRNIISKFFRKT